MADENSAEHFRLFMAIAMPEPVRDAILRVQRELQSLVPRDVVRWTKPEQFHLTLRFLGDVAADRVEDLKQSAGAVGRGARALAVRAEGVGFFPNSRAPRVIWAGVHDGEGRLLELQRQIETAVAPLSPERGEKNFAGHVTLGRLKYPKPADIRDLVARAQTLEKRRFGEWTAQEVEIIRSESSPSGARYTTLARFPLGAG
jgi:RNA 2',3'-cyclic 3'-phosphodiesterase